MTMGQTIDPQRLKQLRKSRGLTQKDLAQKARLNEQTVYRLERERKPVRVGNLERLSEALRVEAGVLTGEKPIPSDVSQAATSLDEAAYQLNVRVDAPIRNAFELVARRYRVSVSKIAQLAPLLFVVVAEASLKHRRKKLEELEAALGHISDTLDTDFPHLPVSLFYATDDHEQGIRAEQASINRGDIFGQDRFDPYGETRSYDNDVFNPFFAYLKALTAASDEITINALGRTSTEYRVCRSEAAALAEGDTEVADWLLNGEVPVHQMPRGKTAAESVEWMRQHKISVHKLVEERPEEHRPSILDIEL
jgi:transcriptional regulator with XRE-family HTH domain